MHFQLEVSQDRRGYTLRDADDEEVNVVSSTPNSYYFFLIVPQFNSLLVMQCIVLLFVDVCNLNLFAE